MLALMRRKLKSRKGFTLVELMVVVVIIGILVGIAVPSYKKVTGNAEKNACLANQRTIEGALLIYKMEAEIDEDDEGNITGNLDEIMDKMVEDGYLQEIPKCPTTGGEYVFDVDGDVTCDQPDHKRGGGVE